MKPTPLQKVREQFGSKEKLVDQLISMLEKPQALSKDAFRKKIDSVSSKKLLHLHEVEEKVQELFGGKTKLVEAILTQRRPGSIKVDEDYKQKLESYSKARLFDMYQAFAKKAKKG